MKKTLKGYVAGLLSAVLLMAITTGVFAIAQLRTETVTITYGVGVSLDGTPVQFAADAAPFTLDGRTFLPVRAIADLAGLDVDFNAATNTVLLTSGGGATTTVTPEQPPALRDPVPLTQAAPFTRRNPNNSFMISQSFSAIMSGTTYNDVLEFHLVGSRSSASTFYTLHDLGGQFQVFSGYIGRIDMPGLFSTVTFNIVGDGVLLESLTIPPTAPTYFSVPVDGVGQLRLEIVVPVALPDESTFFGANGTRPFAVAGMLQ